MNTNDNDEFNGDSYIVYDISLIPTQCSCNKLSWFTLEIPVNPELTSSSFISVTPLQVCREESWFNFMLVKHTQEHINVSERGYSWSYDLHMHCQPHNLIFFFYFRSHASQLGILSTLRLMYWESACIITTSYMSDKLYCFHSGFSLTITISVSTVPLSQVR